MTMISQISYLIVHITFYLLFLWSADKKFKFSCSKLSSKLEDFLPIFSSIASFDSRFGLWSSTFTVAMASILSAIICRYFSILHMNLMTMIHLQNRSLLFSKTHWTIGIQFVSCIRMNHFDKVTIKGRKSKHSRPHFFISFSNITIYSSHQLLLLSLWGYCCSYIWQQRSCL